MFKMLVKPWSPGTVLMDALNADLEIIYSVVRGLKPMLTDADLNIHVKKGRGSPSAVQFKCNVSLSFSCILVPETLNNFGGTKKKIQVFNNFARVISNF